MLGEGEEGSCLFPSLRFDLRLETAFPLSIPGAFPPIPGVGITLCSSTTVPGSSMELLDPVDIKGNALFEGGIDIKVCCGLNE